MRRAERAASGGQAAVFFLQVELQDAAAIGEVGVGIGEIVFGTTDLVFPERHNLHHPLRADARDGEAIEMTFHLDNGQHQLGRQVCPFGGRMDLAQQIQPQLWVAEQPTIP